MTRPPPLLGSRVWRLALRNARSVLGCALFVWCSGCFTSSSSTSLLGGVAECDDDDDCKADGRCVNGACQGTCEQDDDCRSDEYCPVCTAAGCEPVCKSGCRTSRNCGDTFFCDDAHVCENRCFVDEQCSADWPGRACLGAAATVAGRCGFPCTADAECQSGEVCLCGACGVACAEDMTCASPAVCINMGADCPARCIAK